MNIDPIIEQFKQTNRFARLIINDQSSPIEVKYSKLDMELRNLHELPPYIRIKTQTKRSDSDVVQYSVDFSTDGFLWEPIEDPEESESLQIYCIFHPLFILPHTKLEESDSPTQSGARSIEGYYNVADLPLPSVVRDFFIENNENSRRITIIYFENELYAMKQKDFPPFPDTLTLLFNSV